VYVTEFGLYADVRKKMRRVVTYFVNGQTSLGVKITNPPKGQQVGIGKNLILSGTSSYNAASKCGVFVIVDGVRPYQKTTPEGGNDYSKWK